MDAGDASRTQIANRPGAGFSLVELMIVLGIAAIVLTAAVPAFRTLLQNQQVTTAVNDLFAAINLARTEAIKRGALVKLAAADPRSRWENGWIIFVDHNDNDERDGADETIFEHGPLPGGLTITPRFSRSVLKYLSFNGSGRMRTDSHSQPLGSFSFIADGDTRKKITINFLGRPRVCNPATDNEC